MIAVWFVIVGLLDQVAGLLAICLSHFPPVCVP